MKTKNNLSIVTVHNGEEKEIKKTCLSIDK